MHPIHFCCCFVVLSAATAIFSVTSRINALSTTTTTRKQQHVLIVGGGVGGLAIAARIAASSPPPHTSVKILEKNDRAGGRCGSFHVNIDGKIFRHERGPSLLLLPDVYQDTFHGTTGKCAQDFGLIMKQCIPAYQVVFDDGERLDVGFPRAENAAVSEVELQSRKMMNSLEADGARKWDEYMRTCEAFLDCGLPNFIEERLDLASFPAFLREALRDFGKAWPLKPHSDVLDSIFESEKMKAVASFQDLYVGLEPYRNNKLAAGGVLDTTAPAVFGLLAAIELHPTNSKGGVFAPIGGFGAVTESLQKLAESLDVQMQLGATVTSVTEDGVYYSTIEEGNQFERADLVIVNADLPYATESLIEHPIEKPATYDWNDQYRFSSGVIAFHWSLSRPLEDLNTHNVFLCATSRASAEESWRVLRDDNGVDLPFGSIDKPFNFYVHRASKTDPTAAPKVSLFVENAISKSSYSLHTPCLGVGHGFYFNFGTL
jgi:phytoene dehydrogenase-like protein